jgi:hypothetical protein
MKDETMTTRDCEHLKGQRDRWRDKADRLERALSAVTLQAEAAEAKLERLQKACGVDYGSTNDAIENAQACRAEVRKLREELHKR